ncbi:channel protein, hemolysin III family [Scenedesmus sp. NREL 46B-D3]|nr:channel protein, hemolysin III family [Scenedesmus sp. NREL 46B-D3]
MGSSHAHPETAQVVSDQRQGQHEHASSKQQQGWHDPLHAASNMVASGIDAVCSKPRLRGVLHAHACWAVLAAGLILIAEATCKRSRLAAAVYIAAAFFQFAISGLYHTGKWAPSTHKLLRRLDHSAIYSLIAATYTPFVMLPIARVAGDVASRQLLCRIWLGALCGVGKTWLWPRAPKPISALTYVLLGWSAVPYLPQLLDAVGAQVVLLVALGGVLYSIGAFVYASHCPDPYPRWFGYHEVFHTLVLLASICHFAGVYQVVVKMSFGFE